MRQSDRSLKEVILNVKRDCDVNHYRTIVAAPIRRIGHEAIRSRCLGNYATRFFFISLTLANVVFLRRIFRMRGSVRTFDVKYRRAINGSKGIGFPASAVTDSIRNEECDTFASAVTSSIWNEECYTFASSEHQCTRERCRRVTFARRDSRAELGRIFHWRYGWRNM